MSHVTVSLHHRHMLTHGISAQNKPIFCACSGPKTCTWHAHGIKIKTRRCGNCHAISGFSVAMMAAPSLRSGAAIMATEKPLIAWQLPQRLVFILMPCACHVHVFGPEHAQKMGLFWAEIPCVNMCLW